MAKNQQIRTFKHDYDHDNDSLYMYDPENLASASVELGNIIIDLSNQGQVTGIEVLQASDCLQQILASEHHISKEKLEEISSTKVEAAYQNNMIFLKLMMAFGEETVIANLAAPIANMPSPAIRSGT